jgi:predicted AAA+ superfamily ATPase
MSTFDITKKLTKEYCVLRYKQEQAFKEFKSLLDDEIKSRIQDIIEEGISKRNIENHRTAFEKLIGTSDYFDPSARIKTPAEKAEIIFAMMLDTIEKNRSNNSFAYKERYIGASDVIQRYFIRYFENKLKIDQFKAEQTAELNVIVEEMKGEGIPLFIVKYVYKRLKADADLKAISPSELGYSETLYNDLKQSLFEEISK